MSKIQWTEKTWNPVIGCTPVSEGCRNCYAATMARRLSKMPNAKDYHDRGGLPIAKRVNGRDVFTGQVRCLEHRLDEPLKRRKPTTYFVNSMSDLFHEDVPFEFIDKVFAVMALTPQHRYQILTKRPERMAECINAAQEHRIRSAIIEMFRIVPPAALNAASDYWVKYHGDDETRGFIPYWPLPNVWLGTSAENQETLDARLPHLLRCPAAVRFLSLEPLLSAIDISRGWYAAWEAAGRADSGWKPEHCGRTNGGAGGVEWVIVGGESGAHARPCTVAWIRSIVAQCKAAGVPCFVKQLGARIVAPNDTSQEWPEQGDEWIFDADTELRYQGEPIEFRIRDPKAGDPAEWPEDLRVREMPR